MLPQNSYKMNYKQNQNKENVGNIINHTSLLIDNRIIKINKEIPKKISNQRENIVKKIGFVPKAVIDMQPQKVLSHHSVKSKNPENIQLSQFYYEKEILKYILQKDQQINYQNSLQNQKLSPELRTKMVDWMIEVMSSYKCNDQTFFLAVQLMDLYYANCGQNQELDQLHFIGVTSMFIASKYNEIYPIKIKTFYEKIGHYKISPDQIKSKELQILQALNFNIGNPTILDFCQIFSLILNIKQLVNLFQYQIFQETYIYISKMLVHDYQILNEFRSYELAVGVTYLGIKIINHINDQFQYQDKINELLKYSKIDTEKLNKIAQRLINWINLYDQNFQDKYQNLKIFCQYNQQNLEILQRI